MYPRKIIYTHCLSCHSKYPTHETRIGQGAPNGRAFDTAEDIVEARVLIKQQAVDSKIMPQDANKTITDEERKRLGMWIDQGAKLE